MRLPLLTALLSLLLLPNPTLSKYISPALTLPPTPSLPKSLHQGYVNLSNVDIYTYQFGPPLPSSNSSKIVDNSPILFLHGAYASSRYFAHQIHHLTQHYPTRSIIALDSRLQGRSTGARSQPIDYALMRDDVLGVLDHFNIPKVILVGWSDGGIIGLSIAMAAPERLERYFGFGASFSVSNVNATGPHTSVGRAVSKRAIREYEQSSPEERFQKRAFKKINKMLSTLPEFSRGELGGIPTLSEDCENAPLVWFVDGSEEEMLKRGTARELRGRVQDSGLVLLPGVSHYAFLQDPATFNAVLGRFLDTKVDCGNCASASDGEEPAGC